ncbi:MAG: RNA polymerase sigma-70 factor [Ferruginibacter sp.]
MQKSLSSYELFQQVFFEHYKPLCQYALTLTKDPHDCEDIVQEVLLRIWEKRQDLLDKKEIKFYLFTAVHNNCITSQGKKRKLFTVEYTGQEKISDSPVFSIEKKAELDVNELVKEALDRLPPKCREVFVLSRLSNLTYHQIAALLGISVKTVENQMGKAIRMMRSFLKEQQALSISSTLFISLIAMVR